MNFKHLTAVLGKLTEKRLRRNVIAHKDEDGVISIWYCGNLLITYYPNGRIEINTGLRTYAVYKKLNQFLPKGFYVYQVFSPDYKWLLGDMQYGTQCREFPAPDDDIYACMLGVN